MSTGTQHDIFKNLVRKLAQELSLPASVIEEVVRHQWKMALQATKTASSVELSGIGYLYASPAKLNRGLAKAHRIMGTYQQRPAHTMSSGMQLRIASCQEQINKFKNRLSDVENRLERSAAGNVQCSSRKRMDKKAGCLPV